MLAVGEHGSFNLSDNKNITDNGIKNLQKISYKYHINTFNYDIS